VSNYEDLIPGLTLPDPDDRHVLAAAIRAGADAIVTLNLADFPPEALAKYDIEALHPDELIDRLLDFDCEVIRAEVKLDRQSLKNPPKSVEEYLSDLERHGLRQTVASFRRFYSEKICFSADRGCDPHLTPSVTPPGGRDLSGDLHVSLSRSRLPWWILRRSLESLATRWLGVAPRLGERRSFRTVATRAAQCWRLGFVGLPVPDLDAREPTGRELTHGW